MSIDVDEAKVNRNEFGLWAGWTLATAAALVLGFALPALVINNVELGIARIVLPLLAGFLVGLFQWLALRSYLTHSADWILHGGASWALAFALGLLLIETLSGSVFGTILGYLLFGVILAVVQWPVLRREIPQVLPWVLANVIGWGLGALLSQLALNLFVAGDVIQPFVTSLVHAVVTGLVAGALTGLALVYIVRRPEL